MTRIDLSDSSESGDSEWQNELIFLRPAQVWMKPTRSMAALTAVSTAINPDKAADGHAVLQANTDGQSTVLCSLFPHRPNQVMRLVWSADQEMSLLNAGVSPLTVSLMTRRVEL
jgi:hypothetical protein